MSKPLRVWRTKRLLSVRALADAAGVSTKTIVQLEYGRQRPNYLTIRRLSEALQVEPNEVAEFATALEERGKDAA